VDLLRALPRSPAPENFLSWVKEEAESPRRGKGKAGRRSWLALAALFVLSLSGAALWPLLAPPSRSSIPRQEASKLQEAAGGTESRALAPAARDGPITEEVIEVALPGQSSPEEMKSFETKLRADFELGGSALKDSELPSDSQPRKAAEPARGALLPPRAASRMASPGLEGAAARVEFTLQVHSAELPRLQEYIAGWAQKQGGRVASEVLAQKKKIFLERGEAAVAEEAESISRVPVRIVVSVPSPLVPGRSE
jgi:hypothetical protein